MPQFDASMYQSQVIWLLICLTLVVLFLRKYLLPRLSKIYDERHTHILSENEKIQKINDSIDALRTEREEKLKQAKAEAKDILEEARFESEKSQNAQITAIDHELSARLVEFKEQLAWHMKTYERDFNQNLESLVQLAKNRFEKPSEQHGDS